MPLDERDPAHLWDMLEAARTAVTLIEGLTVDSFLADRRQQLALERTLEIVGEAARRVSEGCRMEHPEIPWRQIVALRNVLAHDYGEIDERRVWQVARKEIPGLIAKLASILPRPPEIPR